MALIIMITKEMLDHVSDEILQIYIEEERPIYIKLKLDNVSYNYDCSLGLNNIRKRLLDYIETIKL